MGWSIPTEKLGKRGPRESIRGYAFQDAYICLQMILLLDERQGIAAVRPEGAQDVDLLYNNSSEEYIQLKNIPNERYSLKILRPILQSFAKDLIKAGRTSTLTLSLIARSNTADAATVRLKDKIEDANDIAEIAKLLATPVSPSYQCLAALNEEERHDLAKQLWRQTKFNFGMGDELDGCLSFEAYALKELAKHGVESAKLKDAFNVLKDALYKQREFTRADIEELLKYEEALFAHFFPGPQWCRRA